MCLAQLKVAESQSCGFGHADFYYKAKGAPGSKCQTSTQLVSPATGHEKKRMDPSGTWLKNINLGLLEPD